MSAQAPDATTANEVLAKTLRSYQGASSTIETTRGRGIDRHGFTWTFISTLWYLSTENWHLELQSSAGQRAAFFRQGNVFRRANGDEPRKSEEVESLDRLLPRLRGTSFGGFGGVAEWTVPLLVAKSSSWQSRLRKLSDLQLESASGASRKGSLTFSGRDGKNIAKVEVDASTFRIRRIESSNAYEAVELTFEYSPLKAGAER